jgi:predicted transcriptional regulator
MPMSQKLKYIINRDNVVVGLYEHLTNLPIEDAAPHILRRPILYVEPNTRMLQVAAFLAIGPEIYVDGLLVIGDKVQRGKPIGRISSRHIISNILDFGYPCCMQKNASQMMDGVVMPLEMDSPLLKALEVFKTTGFAFIPILAKSYDMMEGHSIGVAASLAIRDILPLIAKATISMPVKEIASRLISLNGETSVREALDSMLDKSIRNIGLAYQVDSGTGFVETTNITRILVSLWILYAMHLNDNSLFCVFTSLDVICSPNSRFITEMMVSSLFR